MLNSEQQTLKSSRADLQKELEATGTKFKGRACRCPFHEDDSPSAGIFETKSGWYFKCHGCGFSGDIFTIRATLNKTSVADELRKVGTNSWTKSQDKPPEVFRTVEQIAQRFPGVEGVYKYAHPNSGIVELAVVRWRDERGKKHFIQITPTPGGYWMKGCEFTNPIYNRARIRTSDRVVVVEGEKCVHALHDLDIVATTSPGGALKGGLADWKPLAGKTVILWPDADDPTDEWPQGKGVEHMRQIKQILQSLTPAPVVYWVDPSKLNLSDGADVADVIEEHRKKYTKEQTIAVIEDMLADAEPAGVFGDYYKELQATIAGQRRVIGLPWQHLSNLSRALMPSTVTCICGDGGAGKSLFVSQCLVDWQSGTGVKCCIYHMEDDRNFHLRRVHAQMCRDSRLTDNTWVENNGEIVSESASKLIEPLEDIGKRIYTSPEEQVTLEMLETWVESRAKEGYEVIFIDPVTAAQSTARPWVEDLKFITKCKVIARRYGCRVILVTHPRSGAKAGKANHNDMAGGAAYPRFSHCVLWLERNDAATEFRVDTGNGSTFMRPNRLVFIAKARNGPGAGRRIAFNFKGDSLSYEELGITCKDEEVTL